MEGETEETFVNQILAPHLYEHQYTRVSARLLGKARQRNRRGGIRGWNLVRDDIIRHLKEDAGCLATTMVDYYALPQTGQRAWPGRQAAVRLPFSQKASMVQSAVYDDICAEFGAGFPRFVPYVMMHEFEGLLFSDCQRFGEGIGRPDLVPQFQSIREQFETPEHINDSETGAPSRRVQALFPAYQKPLLGTRAARTIGLDTIRDQCPHFGAWLAELETLAG